MPRFYILFVVVVVIELRYSHKCPQNSFTVTSLLQCHSHQRPCQTIFHVQIIYTEIVKYMY